ncbi:LamG-like jellyroll fold domain-containing protein [Botrimarina sp.]|uniref:LamG-like jellyroll fold domain-containing protein n=1 Tax=Botrimarina sp. TaxID=2795802 RepID=UPI0032EB370A
MRHLLTFGILVAACQAANADIFDGLEVYFPLDETSGVTAADGSGNGRAGLLLNRGGSNQNAPGTNGAGPQDPNPGHSPWVSGRFNGGFGPAGAPDQDGDAAPQFGTGSFFAGQPFWMLGANLTNGATTGGTPQNIVSDAFTYSFHVQMPYNATLSKDTSAGGSGSETVRSGQVLHDVQDVNNDGIGLSSADTNYFNINDNGHTQHVNGNRWAFYEVAGDDSLFHHYRGGAVGLNSDTTPPLLDVNGLLQDGEWHHVAIVQDYTIGPGGGDSGIQDAFLYVDGALVGWQQTAGSTAADAVLGIVTLGAQPNTRGGDASRLFYDDYAVWSRALSPAEIGLLSAQSLASIPEPAAAMLAALGMTAGCASRRRR